MGGWKRQDLQVPKGEERRGRRQEREISYAWEGERVNSHVRSPVEQSLETSPDGRFEMELS